MATQPSARAEQAAALLLDDLEETASWLAELDAERAAAEHRRAELVTSLHALLRTMPPETRDRLAPRLGTAAELPRAPSRTLRGGLRDVVAFLAASETDTIRAAEVTRHLRGLGKPVKHTYGGATLAKLEATGHVARVEHGIYRINRAHPDLLASRVGGPPTLRTVQAARP